MKKKKNVQIDQAPYKRSFETSIQEEILFANSIHINFLEKMEHLGINIKRRKEE